MKRTAVWLMCVLMMLSAVLPVSAEGLSEDIVILYTNDIHTYINNPLSYDVVSAVKKDLKSRYSYVYLADAGDHVQGTAYGSSDNGETIIRMMNAAGYDVATLGNHEFDYGMERCMNFIDIAEFPYVSANFYHESDGVRGENVLEDYVILECGDEKIAVVGITTPETFTKSTPAFFQDGEGNFIYGISSGDVIKEDLQSAIDDAKAEGATKVVALGHLGIDESSKPSTSTEIIAGVSGLDAFIDGHSHSVVEHQPVKDKDGKDVVLTQTGQYFDRIGMMVIDSETGEVSADFIECEEMLAEDGKTVTGYKLSSELYSGEELISDADVKSIKDAWIGEIDKKLGEKIGFSEVVFNNYDADGNRLVRIQSTNTGDFSSDALYYLFDSMEQEVDVAFMHGGGLRNGEITGDITYKSCKDVHTFGNVACLQEVSGQQILDALEWGARYVGEGESGAFLHASGLTYKIDTSVPNTVRKSEHEIWEGAPDKYRVYDVKVYNRKTNTYEAIDTEKTYRLAGYNYTLRDMGDGYAMFDGAVNVLDYVMEDYMVFANYVKSFEGEVVGAVNSPLLKKYPGMLIDYENVNGSGRIVISDGADAENDDVKPTFSDVDEADWYYGDVEYAVENGLMYGVSDNEFNPDGSLTRAMLVTVLYRAEGEPATNRSIPFADVDMGAYYANAVSWAKQNGIVSGVSETEFAPDKKIKREEIAAIIYRYAMYKGYDVSENTNILSYNDFDKISEYAIAPLQYAVDRGLIKGKTEATLNPEDTATRAECVAILHRFLTVV